MDTLPLVIYVTRVCTSTIVRFTVARIVLK